VWIGAIANASTSPHREGSAARSAAAVDVFDNDKKYGTDVLAVIGHRGIRRKQIKPYSPWQNGAGERWVGTVPRDLLDQVIVGRSGAKLPDGPDSPNDDCDSSERTRVWKAQPAVALLVVDRTVSVRHPHARF
jgi:transposase InsO family protein